MNTLQNSISANTQYKSVDVSAQTAASGVVTPDAGTTSSTNTKKVTTSVSAQQVAVNAAISSANAKQSQASTNAATHSGSADKQSGAAMEVLNNKLAQLNNQMQFKKDEVSGLTYFSLIDTTTHKVIKQYPSEDFLYVARRLTEYLDRVNSSKPLNASTGSGNLSSAIGNIISESA